MYYLLFTIYYLLFTIYYLLFTTYYLLLTTYYLLFTTYYIEGGSNEVDFPLDDQPEGLKSGAYRYI